ncbi:trypsin-like peptidase domain-containing protein, partial [Verrucomicrobium sp. BvORR034]|uniref:S1C family serine protease n=1 Tax=Verrucomicrobium sp. BvORR034 TaxID=1396418 RepID=UPI002240FEEF
LLVLAAASAGGLLWQNSRSVTSVPGPAASGANTVAPAPGKSHPLAEWYVLGRHLGREAAIAYEDFGLPFQADRGQIAHLLKSLEVDVKQIAPDAITMCWDGYQDETTHKAAAWSVPTTQKRSILPKPIQGFVQFTQPQAEPAKNQTALEHALAATVLIKVDSRKGEGHGSGFFVAPGLIVTNKHVIEGATSIQVRVNEETILPAQLVAASANNDIAIVRVRTKDHPLLALADSDSVKVGDDVSAIGYPLLDHLSATTSFGRISSSDRTFAGNPCFQIDLSINHGNSGGPLVDHTGRAIGINTFGLGDYNVDRFNFAIKINAVLPFIKKHLAEAE